jgi:tetratricopeptide (TPR) repeat protein
MASEFSKHEIQELRKPDEFVGFFQTKINQLENRRKEIFWGLLLSLIAIGLGFFYQSSKHGTNQVAAGEFEKVMEKLPSNLSQDTGDWNAFLTEVNSFIEKNPNTSITPSAHLYKGKALFSLKQYPEALTAYQKAASEMKAPYSYLAMEGEAITQMQLEKWTEASAVWKKLVDKKDNPLRDFHLYNLALVQDQLGQAAEATITREMIAKDFPSSAYANTSELKQSPITAASQK